MFRQVYTYYIHINSRQKFKLYSDDIGEVLQKAHSEVFVCSVSHQRELKLHRFYYDSNDVRNGKDQGMKVQGLLGCCEKHKRKEGHSFWSP